MACAENHIEIIELDSDSDDTAVINKSNEKDPIKDNTLNPISSLNIINKPNQIGSDASENYDSSKLISDGKNLQPTGNSLSKETFQDSGKITPNQIRDSSQTSSVNVSIKNTDENMHAVSTTSFCKPVSENKKVLPLPTDLMFKYSTSKLPVIPKSNKTLAFIPISCLKYCEVKNGKFTVDLNTLKNIKDPKSVFLYNLPKGTDLGTNFDNAKNLSILGKKVARTDVPDLFALSSSCPIQYKKSDQTVTSAFTTPKIANCSVKNTKDSNQNSDSPALTKNNDESNLEQSPVITSSSMIKIISQDLISCNTKQNEFDSSVKAPIQPISQDQVSCITKRNEFDSSDKPPIQPFKYNSTTNRNPLFKNKRMASNKATKRNISFLGGSGQLPSNKYKTNPTVKLVDLMQIVNQPSCSTTDFPLIDLSDDRDPLDISDYSVKCVPKTSELGRHERKPIKKTSEPKNQVQAIPGGLSSSRIDSETDSADESVAVTNSSNFSDPLYGTPNIFEPIVTIKEKKSERFISSNSCNKKINESELAVSNKLPHQLWVQSKYLKYCKIKNGNYFIDIAGMKKINSDQSKNESSNGSKLAHVDTNSQKRTERISQRQRSICHTYKYSQYMKSFLPSAETSSDQCQNLFIKTSSDQCRNLFIKTSAFEKLDPSYSQCRGFNDREVNISKACLTNLSEYLSSCIQNPKLLVNRVAISLQVDVAQSCETDMHEIQSQEDLYITKKIDILDTKGRRIRTQHIKQKHIENTAYKLPETKPCHVVIRRNGKVENLIKAKLKHDETKRMLLSKIRTYKELARASVKPIIILNKNNFNAVKLTENLCQKCCVLYVKNTENDFPEKMYKDEFFISLVKKNYVKLTTAHAVTFYFQQKKILNEF